MTFQELLDTITSSEPDDWHKIICGGAGPSYRDRLEFFSVYEGQSNTLFSDSHGVVVAYKPNLSITMAWGLTAHDDFQEPWANRFPDPKVSSHYVDVFYNNALVYRALYVALTVPGHTSLCQRAGRT